MTNDALTRRALIAIVLLAGWALRLHALGAKSLWYDELRQVEVAQLPLSQMSAPLIKHAARPLDYLITHVWLRGVGPVDEVPGRAEFWLRFPAALFSLLSVAATLPLARRWLRRSKSWGPLAAAALMAAAPLGVTYGQELRPYTLYLLLSVLSLCALERALAGGAKRDWAAFGLITTAGTLTHFFFAFALAAQAVYVAGWAVYGLARRRGRHVRRGLAGFGLSAAAGTAALLVAARPEHLVVFAQRFLLALVSAPGAGLISDQGSAVALGAAVNADFFLRGVLPFFGGGGGLALVPFVGLAGLGLARLARRDPARLALALLWLLLAPALVIVYLQYRQEFFALRYILFVLPVYLLLAVEGLTGLAAWAKHLRPAVGADRGRMASASPLAWGLATLSAALLVGLQLGQVRRDYGVPKDDWRRVGAFLTANVRPGDTLGAPDVQALVRFYAPRQPGTLVDANDRGPHEQALANGERFWFVWSDYTLIPIDETRAWVEGLPSVSVQLDPRIRVIFVHPGRTVAEMLKEAEGFVIPPPSLEAR